MLAVTGGKGGVGKTTTALGVAATLARDGRRPVVVDADLDTPDLAAMARVEEVCLEATAAGRPVSRAPTVAGVTVVGATPGTDPSLLRRALDRLTTLDRTVLVDCPAGTGTDHGVALAAASVSLLVTRPTRRALTDAVKTATLARRLGAPPTQLAVTDVSEVPEAMHTPTLPPPVAVPPPEEFPEWSVESDRFTAITPCE